MLIKGKKKFLLVLKVYASYLIQSASYLIQSRTVLVVLFTVCIRLFANMQTSVGCVTSACSGNSILAISN